MKDDFISRERLFVFQTKYSSNLIVTLCHICMIGITYFFNDKIGLVLYLSLWGAIKICRSIYDLIKILFHRTPSVLYGKSFELQPNDTQYLVLGRFLNIMSQQQESDKHDE